MARKASVSMKFSRARIQEGNVFLESIGWKNAKREFLTHDASFRHYERVWRNTEQSPSQSAVLMDAPPPWEGVESFIKITHFLKNKGISVPTLYGQDIQKGFLLLEDFGDETFTKALFAGKNKKDLYIQAIDILIHLHKTVSQEELSSLEIPKYTQESVLQEVLLFFDWYIPGVLGRPLSDAKKQEFIHLFLTLYKEVSHFPSSFALRDYHVDNLMVVSKKTGVLDFQDALEAPLVYDLVSLLEDARQDMEEDLSQELLTYYKNSFSTPPWGAEENFSKAFSFWGLQRSLRILGVFTRLAFRDKKDRYLSYVPRLWQWVEKDLSHPFLKSLHLYFEEILPKETRIIPSPFWPKQAIILAAGLGKRMLPLTKKTPKPLLPFRQDTLLGFALEQASSLSLSTVAINTHHLADQIKEYVRKKVLPMPFSTVLTYEPLLLETGGGVTTILPYLDKDKPFFMMASDLIWSGLIESPLLQLARLFDPEKMDALLVVTPTTSQEFFQIHGYTGPGDFFLEKDNTLRFREQEKTAPYVFPSLQILKPSLFEGEEVRPFSVVDIYKKAQRKGRLFGLLIKEGSWFHVGTPEAYELLHHSFS